MSFIVTTAIKDLRRRLADPFSLVLWIGIPILIGSLIGMASGGSSGSTPRAKVLLVDQDDSFLSQLLNGASGGESPLDIESADLADAQARMGRGEASALVVLPEGFAQAVLEEEPTRIRLVKNPSQRILPGIVEGSLEMLVEVVFYGHRLFGESIKAMTQPLPGDSNFMANAAVAAIAVQINEKMQQLDSTLFPPALIVEAEPQPAEEEVRPKRTIASFLFPSILLMSLMFVAQGMSEDLWKEKDQGTLRRLVSSPRGVGAMLLGKYFAGAMLMFVVSAAALLAGVLVLGLEPQQPLQSLAWCMFSGTVLLAIFGWLQLLAKNQRAGNIMTTIVLFPLMMIGGSFFPLEAMPSWMAAIGEWTPNGQALIALNQLLGGEASLADLGSTILLLAAPALVLFFLSLRRLRGSFAR